MPECQRNGEDGLVAVDDIHAHDEGNAQTAMVDSHFLQLANLVGPLQVEHAAHLSGSNLLSYIGIDGTAGDDVASHLQVQLSDFFLERHLGHQFIHEFLHGFDGLNGFLGLFSSGKTFRNYQGACNSHHPTPNTQHLSIHSPISIRISLYSKSGRKPYQ